MARRAATTEYRYRDEFYLEAVTPSNSSGSFDVKVVNPDDQKIVASAAFLSVSEKVYNYPNPFVGLQGTTFRYVTNEDVREVKVKIYNLNGEPITILKREGNGEIKWSSSNLNFGVYIYQMEVKLETGQIKTFQKLLQIK